MVCLMVGRFLFRCARWISRQALLGRLIGLVFERAAGLLPIRRLEENERVVAFFHPRPAFDEHILIVPKKAISTFAELLVDGHTQYIADVVAVAEQMVRERCWREYSLGVNGGPYQDVRQVHFHLYSERIYYKEFHGEDPETIIHSIDGLKAFWHPNPSREIHILICCDAEFALLGQALSRTFSDLNEAFELTQNGFTVFVQMTDLPARTSLILHVLSGEENRHGTIGSAG